MRSAHRAALLALALALLAAVLLVMIVFSRVLHDFHGATSARVDDRTSSSLRSALRVSESPSAVIILQRSIVDPHRQCERLDAIDNTWARWASKENIAVAAMLPADTNCSLAPARVTKIPLAVSLATRPADPFSNLFHAFQVFLTKYPDSDWAILGNDHTFFLPRNLQRFLSALDRKQLVYSGSKLALNGVGQGTLPFASGGAGAVFSASAVRLVMAIWCTHERLQSSATRDGVMYPRLLLEDRSVSAAHYVDLLEFAMQSAKMVHAGGWVGPHPPRERTLTMTVHLDASHRLELALATGTAPGVPLLEWSLHNNTDLLAAATHTQLLEACVPRTRWEIDNPGVMVAACLRVLNVPFTDSTLVDSTGCRERFHCFGPARLAAGDVDDWFVKGKALAHRGSPCQDAYRVAGGPVISFHYVEAAEAAALFRLLGRPVVPPGELLGFWPRTAQQLGGYSRAVATVVEAEALRAYVSSIDVGAARI